MVARRFAALVIVLCLLSGNAYADLSRSSLLGSASGPVKRIIKLLDDEEANPTSSAERSSIRIPKLIINGLIPGTGRYRLTFDSQRLMDLGDTSETLVFLQGTGTFLNKNTRRRPDFPAAATLSKSTGGYTAELFLNGDTKARTRLTALFGISLSLDSETGMKVLNLDRARWAEDLTLACGSTTSAMRAPASSLVQTGPIERHAGTLQALELVLQMDQDWASQFGSQAVSEIATIVNAVETIYERDLGVTFDVKGIDSTPVNLSSTDGGDALQEYSQSNPSTPADLYHLFSAKNSGLLGIAYLGVVCASPSLAFGITYRSDTAEDILTMAHEMGHNFDAEHDDASDPPTIMFSSSAANLVSEFSGTSKSQVESFLNRSGSCLSSTQEAAPAPDPDATATPTPTATPVPDNDDGDDPVDPGDDGFDSSSVELDVFQSRFQGAQFLFVESYNDFDFVGSQD
ncbi:MAG: hypothetical protein KDD42_09380, partial [Bdellovibrionales bacterium]|nr:hypothetical protein [Bdellovibrionales bacterium]